MGSSPRCGPCPTNGSTSWSCPRMAMTMPPEALRVLLIEDDEDDFLIARSMLRSQHRFSIDLDWVDSYDAGLVSLREGRHDLYIVDYRLGKGTGLDLIRDACGCDP